jgi:hypothetical protein
MQVDEAARLLDAWKRGLQYARAGLRLARQDPLAYVVVGILFSLPALLAALLTITSATNSFWQQSGLFFLRSLTIVLGTMVIMMLVGHHARGLRPSLLKACWHALRWTPRYLWTNAHTSLIFWGPVLVLLAVRTWQESRVPLPGMAGILAHLGWSVGIGSLALYLHVRTLLAPFLAVHSDLPGTLATLESWRLSSPSFLLCLTTFIAGCTPIGVPLLAVAGIALVLQPQLLAEHWSAIQGDLAWAGIQLLRPVLIPALYLLYVDLWEAARKQRQCKGEPAVPLLARWLLALTRPLPKWGKW